MGFDSNSPSCLLMSPVPPPGSLRTAIIDLAVPPPPKLQDLNGTRGFRKRLHRKFESVQSNPIGGIDSSSMVAAVEDLDISEPTVLRDDQNIFKRRRVGTGRVLVMNLAPRIDKPNLKPTINHTRNLLRCAQATESDRSNPVDPYSSLHSLSSPRPSLISLPSMNQVSFSSPSIRTPIRPPLSTSFFSPPPPPAASLNQMVFPTFDSPGLSPGASNWWTKPGRDELKKYLEEKRQVFRKSEGVTDDRCFKDSHIPNNISTNELVSLEKNNTSKKATQNHCYICSQKDPAKNTPKLYDYFSSTALKRPNVTIEQELKTPLTPNIKGCLNFNPVTPSLRQTMKCSFCDKSACVASCILPCSGEKCVKSDLYYCRSCSVVRFDMGPEEAVLCIDCNMEKMNL